jgi:hypothetical protein
MPPILVIALMESDHNPCGIKITAAMGSLTVADSYRLTCTERDGKPLSEKLTNRMNL